MQLGANFSLGAFYETTQNNGLANVAALTDNHLYKANGDYAEFNRDVNIPWWMPVSAAMANVEQVQLKKKTEADRISSAYYATQQTSQRLGTKDFLPTGIELKSGDSLEALLDNTNNNQVESILYIATQMKGFKFADTIDIDKHPTARLDEWTATTALTGGAWSDPGAITTIHSYKVDKYYKIIGMQAHSATLYAARLVYSGEPWRPGIIGADLPELSRMLYADFGTFKGSNLPALECLASGNDGDVYYTMLVEQVG